VPASFASPVLLIIAAVAGFALVWWWGSK